VIVRPAGDGDVTSIGALYHRVWHDTHGPHMPPAERARRDEEDFRGRIRELMPNVVLSQDDGYIIGFAAWSSSLLGQIYVESAYRGTGVAERLMAAAEAEMAAQGVHQAELHCLVGNERAHRFYERSGWVAHGIISERVRGEAEEETREFWNFRKAL
jgi:GNAT superfamily N-acetyltransferase